MAGEPDKTLVYLHARGGTEQDGAPLIRALPKVRVMALRGPLAEGGGFSWFRNQGIGIADPESLAATVAAARRWLLSTSWSKPPWLCGFSNGAAMAAALALADPASCAGLVMIGGCLVGDPPAPGRLAGLPVLFCRGDQDRVMPDDLSNDSWTYLSGPGGARAERITYAGGHALTDPLLDEVAAWLDAQP